MMQALPLPNTLPQRGGDEARRIGATSASEHPVWRALQTYRIGAADSELTFEARLARENGWTPAFTREVMEEYRRFCFLAITSGCPVTPSDAVDQVWHLHLTYTRDYWDRFCPQVLERRLHHGPTEGGSAEQHRFFVQYAQTLHAYERAFGTAPPENIWPSAARRLVHDPRARRVHPADVLVLPWRAAWIGLGLVAAVGLMSAAYFAS